MVGFTRKPRRNRNEGWLTFEDGQKAPVYTMQHATSVGGVVRFPRWTEERLAELCVGPRANPQRRARWRKEMELTHRLLAENGGRIRVFVTKADDDQSDVCMMELQAEGDWLVCVDRRNEGDVPRYLLGLGTVQE